MQNHLSTPNSSEMQSNIVDIFLLINVNKIRFQLDKSDFVRSQNHIIEIQWVYCWYTI